MSCTDLTGGGAPLGVLLKVMVAHLGPFVLFLSLSVIVLCRLQEALSRGDIATLQESVVEMLPHPVELLLRFVPLGFALLANTLGVLSVCVL